MNILQAIGLVDKILDALRNLTVAVRELSEELRKRNERKDGD